MQASAITMVACIAAAAAMFSLPCQSANDTVDTPVTVGVPTGFESKTADLSDGIRIHYVIGGSGPPLLLVHGWPETWYEWRKMMPLLAKHYTVVAADLRGMGDSSFRSDGYDKKTLGNDMHGLMNALGYDKVTLIGHDWGAPIAYAYAAAHRDSVHKLVMVEGAPMGSWLPTTDVLWFFSFLRIPNYAEHLLAGREREFLHYFYENDAFHAVPGAFDAASIDAYSRSYARPQRMRATYGLYRSIPQDVQDTDAFARQPLTIPVLAIGAELGAGDLIASSTRKVATNVTTTVFRQTGHFIPEERPEALGDVILRFLHDEPVKPEWRP